MKHTPKKLLSLMLALVMALSLTTPALAVEPEAEAADTNTVTYADLAVIDEALVPAGANAEEIVSIQEAINILLEGSGLSQEILGTQPEDYISMAKSLGMIDGTEDLDADISQAQLSNMINIFDQLQEAIEDQTPLFLNDMAQPIFPYTSGAAKEGYSNENSNTIRYSVYVETNYDTDGDGNLDLVKALVQMPRAAAEGKYKAATIYEARPYITGCTPLWGYDENVYKEGGYNIESMYGQPKARNSTTLTISNWTSALDFVNAAQSSDWYYYNPYEQMYDYEDLDWYDYYLVRGFAVVEAGGLGTKDSEGFETCGTDLEIDAFKCIIEWIHGDRVAYTDKNATTAIEAYWSNGKVGMTGRSYAGTTQFGLATTGVAGLETIVPVAGIASWYDYTNSQGISTNRNAAYSDMLAGYCAGRYLDNNDWNSIVAKYGSYLEQLRQDQLALNGDYATSAKEPHWESRDYTLDADNIKCSALIVHGLADYNVRPKHFEMMYDAFAEAGTNVKLLLHQDGHVTPTHPASEFSFLIGDQSYDEILNKWFSHYLYGVDNGIENMATVTAQDSHENVWNTYDSWSTENAATMEVADEGTTTISSNYSANGINSRNWQATFAAGSTNNNAMFIADVEEDMVIKGHVDVTFRATVANEDVADNAPRGETQTIVDHDDYMDPNSLEHDLYMNPSVHESDEVMTVSTPDEELIDRDALMVSAMLVDISDTAFPVFNTSGSYVPKNTLAEDSYWQAGNLKKFDLVELMTSDVNYKIITRGWMDLCNPDAGFVSSSANEKVNLVEGQYYEYTISLQPNVYEVPAGHELALVIYAHEPSMKSYSQNYTITLDNASISAVIPVDGESVTLTSVYDQIGTEYDLDVSAGTGGTVEASVENGKVAADTEVTVTATANSGYKFTGWTVNGETSDITDSTATFTITEDTTIVANFAQKSSGGGGGSSVTKYALTFDTNGGSTVTKVTKAAGTTIDLSNYTTTKEGYTFAGWYADEDLTNAVSSVKLTKNTTVYADWTKDAQSSGLSYTDVDDNDWFYEAVEYVTDNGIMNGTSAITFAPNVSTTRGMIVTMLYRMEGEPTVKGENPFTDVAVNQYYADPVIWAAANGIVKGTSDTTFAPNQDITREQLTAILYRYAQYKGYDISVGEDTNILSYSDAESVSSYAVSAMQWAVGSSLINGISGNLEPQGGATRAQVATMLMRFAENVAE